MPELINHKISDVASKNVIQIPTALYYLPEFKGLKSGAREVYGYLLKRQMVSEKGWAEAMDGSSTDDFQYIDEDGSIYALMSEDELVFHTGFSRRSMNNYLNALEEVGLIERDRGFKEITKFYVKKIQVTTAEFQAYEAEKKAFREEMKKKRSKDWDKKKQAKIVEVAATTTIEEKEVKELAKETPLEKWAKHNELPTRPVEADVNPINPDDYFDWMDEL